MPKEINKKLPPLSLHEKKECTNDEGIIIVEETCPSPVTGDVKGAESVQQSAPMTRARTALMVSTEARSDKKDDESIKNEIMAVSHDTKKRFDGNKNDDDSSRFVTNLKNEIDAEQEGTLNDVDKNFLF